MRQIRYEIMKQVESEYIPKFEHFETVPSIAVRSEKRDYAETLMKIILKTRDDFITETDYRAQCHITEAIQFANFTIENFADVERMICDGVSDSEIIRTFNLGIINYSEALGYLRTYIQEVQYE